jgi:hypothetical protein
VILCLIAPVPADAGPRNEKVYCIQGSPTGTPWDWEIRAGGMPTVLASAAGLSVPSAGTTADLRDTFVSSINNAAGLPPWLFAQEAPITAPCTSSDAAFLIAGQDPFDLWAGPTGSLLLVGPGLVNAVSFNPQIFQLPEPGGAPTLVAGGVAVILLARRSARTRGRSRAGQVSGRDRTYGLDRPADCGRASPG